MELLSIQSPRQYYLAVLCVLVVYLQECHTTIGTYWMQFCFVSIFRQSDRDKEKQSSRQWLYLLDINIAVICIYDVFLSFHQFINGWITISRSSIFFFQTLPWRVVELVIWGSYSWFVISTMATTSRSCPFVSAIVKIQFCEASPHKILHSYNQLQRKERILMCSCKFECELKNNERAIWGKNLKR